MNYLDYEDRSGWILKEVAWTPEYLGKCEAIMSLGNGYLGLRSATEENYLGEQRDMLVAGTFNKAGAGETSELPNAADVTEMNITLGGEKFDLTKGTVKYYERSLNFATGELARNIIWISPNGKEYKLVFRRFVSQSEKNVIAQKVDITPIDDCTLQLVTGVNGRMNNEGVSHFNELERRLIDKKIMRYTQKTNESEIAFVIATQVDITSEGAELDYRTQIGMERRRIFCTYSHNLEAGKTVTIEKISNVHTSRDAIMEGRAQVESTEELQEKAIAHLKECAKAGYDKLFEASVTEWNDYWKHSDIEIESDNAKDQLAIRFALYHLKIMTQFEGGTTNVGAKGLSGEAYKNHTFWDTEIFVLPYFIYTLPDVAKSLIEYRYNTLDGARKKAASNGFDGAQFPWESAWIEDGEVTPEFGDADIMTGLPQVIWTGKIEQHITSDVIYGLITYYNITGDEELMRKCGYEMIYETARFWCSRFEPGEDGMLHINNVIGPDEYKEHVDDNAYTNYMAYWNVKQAIEFYDKLVKDSEVYSALNDKISVDNTVAKCQEIIDKIYLPKENENGIIPQNKTYLDLEEIDLTKYKKQDFVLGIIKDYSPEQLNFIQVSKQADMIILYLTLEQYFSKESKDKNFRYYEQKTLHDSSLSLSTHCILANDIDDTDMAHDLWKKLIDIDMGQNMKSSNAGIHAATMGGIWQSVVFGFGGLRLAGDQLRIEAKLPEGWASLKFKYNYKGKMYQVTESEGKTEVVEIG